jgi:hypothetical protein
MRRKELGREMRRHREKIVQFICLLTSSQVNGQEDEKRKCLLGKELKTDNRLPGQILAQRGKTYFILEWPTPFEISGYLPLFSCHKLWAGGTNSRHCWGRGLFRRP